MTQFELNKIRSKLRKIDINEDFIECYLQKLQYDNESYITAVRKIERWEKREPGQFVLQALACGLIAAVAGGVLAVVG